MPSITAHAASKKLSTSLRKVQWKSDEKPSLTLLFKGSFGHSRDYEIPLFRYIRKIEKRLLFASCLSVRLPSWNNWAPTGQILMKFRIWGFFLKQFSVSLSLDLLLYICIYKVKVMCSRYRPGVAKRVGRGIALLFHDCGTRRRWVVSSTPRPHFTSVKDPVPILQEAGWAPGPVWTGGKSRPHRDSIPDRPSRSSVAIRTEVPAHTHTYTHTHIYIYICIYKCEYFRSHSLIFFGSKYILNKCWGKWWSTYFMLRRSSKIYFRNIEMEGWYACMSEIVCWRIRNGSQNGATIPPTHNETRVIVYCKRCGFYSLFKQYISACVIWGM